MMLVLYGPTATGKTALALKIAQEYSGEIVSADSRQVYQKLDIGSGKVSFTARVKKCKSFWIVDGIKIHGFDLVEPGRNFSVYDFMKFANNAIIQINKQNKLPILVGGTGFYIKSLLMGIDTVGVKPDRILRQKLEKLQPKDLYQILLKIDSGKAKAMNESDRANPRRLIRAIEIAKAISQISLDTKLALQISKLSNNNLQIGLTAPNSFLYQKADKWLAERLNYGLIKEVSNLLKSGIDPLWLEKLGLEYRWITRLVLNKTSKNVAIERLKGDIHAFIRRQKTFFRQFPQIELYDVSSKETSKMLEERIAKWYTQNKNGFKKDNKS